MQKYDLKIIGNINDTTLRNFLNVAEESKNKKLTIFLTSSGGDADVTSAILDYIKINKLNLTIHCYGQVESAALTILSTGTTKLSAPTCIFGSHLPTAGSNLKGFKKWRNDMEHKKKLQHFTSMVVRTQGPMTIKKKFSYYSVKEMLSMGLLDGILGEDCKVCK